MTESPNTKAKILTLTNTLIDNIALKKNGRISFFDGNINHKLNALYEIRNFLQGNNQINESQVTMTLTLLRDICAIKRNGWGFFAPHSMQEFNTFIKQHNLKPIANIKFHIHPDDEANNLINDNAHRTTSKPG